jgi:hypothetical protein
MHGWRLRQAQDAGGSQIYARLAQPGQSASPAEVEPSEERRVVGDPATRRRSLGDYQRWDHKIGPSIALCRQSPSDARLPVEPSKELLDIDNHRFDLHDEQRAAVRMPGEEVDAAALSEVVERELGVY